LTAQSDVTAAKTKARFNWENLDIPLHGTLRHAAIMAKRCILTSKPSAGVSHHCHVRDDVIGMNYTVGRNKPQVAT
jgi:hypothetical protein